MSERYDVIVVGSGTAVHTLAPSRKRLYQVHGDHSEDPAEGHCSKQYPWPPVSHEPRVQQISDALAAGGIERNAADPAADSLAREAGGRAAARVAAVIGG